MKFWNCDRKIPLPQQQLEELESYAFECGADITPHSVLVEKQRVIIDELRFVTDIMAILPTSSS